MQQPQIQMGAITDWAPLTPVDLKFLKHVGACKKLSLYAKKWKFYHQYREGLVHAFSEPERIEIVSRLVRDEENPPYRLAISNSCIMLLGVRFHGNHFTTFNTLLAREDEVRKLPSRFTYRDAVTPLKSPRQPQGLRNLLYLHLVSGELEALPNPKDPTNPSFYKTSKYLTMEIYKK